MDGRFRRHGGQPAGSAKRPARFAQIGMAKAIDQEDVKEERTETVIQLYGRKKKICIPEWFFKIEDVFRQILSVDENEIVKEIIEKVYRKGADDKFLLSGLPVTESGYYRLKRKLEGKIYELYIVRGDVTQDEILSNKLL